MPEIAPGIEFEIDSVRPERTELRFLYDLWNAKRGIRPMPRRGELSVRELKAHLGWVCLIDVLPGDEFRYRLIGTRINVFFQADTTGKTVAESFAEFPEAGAAMHWLLKTACSGKAVRTRGSLGFMRRDLEDFESLFLPFSDDGEIVNMVMNPFVFDTARVYRMRAVNP